MRNFSSSLAIPTPKLISPYQTERFHEYDDSGPSTSTSVTKSGHGSGRVPLPPEPPPLPLLFRMHPGMAVSAERDQVLRMVIGRIMITVVHMEAVIRSADHAPVPVAFPYHVPGRSPGPEAVLGPGTDGSPEPGTEEDCCPAFREGTGMAEHPEPVGVRPVPAERSGRPVECRERKLTFRIHTTPERRTGLEGFEPPTSGLEARRSILAKPQALAPHTMGGSPILTIGRGKCG